MVTNRLWSDRDYGGVAGVRVGDGGVCGLERRRDGRGGVFGFDKESGAEGRGGRGGRMVGCVTDVVVVVVVTVVELGTVVAWEGV